MLLGFILYMLLGAILGLADVSIVEKPLLFMGIMFIVAAIDINSKFGS